MAHYELRELKDKMVLLPARDPGIGVLRLGGFADEARVSGATRGSERNYIYVVQRIRGLGA